DRESRSLPGSCPGVAAWAGILEGSCADVDYHSSTPKSANAAVFELNREARNNSHNKSNNNNEMGDGHSEPEALMPRRSSQDKFDTWSKQNFPVQLFGVVRHTERADHWGALHQGQIWHESAACQLHPNDPPLSDLGEQEAEEAGQQVADFLAAHPEGKIHVVASSPYFRCVQTAVAICRRLGPGVVLMVDHSLGEIFGPEIFGDSEPARPFLRPWKETQEYIRQSGVQVFRHPVVGRMPKWPECSRMGRQRYAERLLSYIRRSSKAGRNFLVVSHAECVGASLALVPSKDSRKLEAVGFGAMMLASRNGLKTHSAMPTCCPMRRYLSYALDWEEPSTSRLFDDLAAQVEVISGVGGYDSMMSSGLPTRAITCSEVDRGIAHCRREEYVENYAGRLKWHVTSHNVGFGASVKESWAIARAKAVLERQGKWKSLRPEEIEELLGLCIPTELLDRLEAHGRPVSPLSPFSFETWPFGSSGPADPMVAGRSASRGSPNGNNNISNNNSSDEPSMLSTTMSMSKLLQRRLGATAQFEKAVEGC
ncbi:unnamed protein product, partial [Polarella glacialis]